jgi:FtsP/CotA-like multicopper oxidase with cupredoxin domain
MLRLVEIMVKKPIFHRFQRSGKCVIEKPIDASSENKIVSFPSANKVGPEVAGRALNRRDFLKLSAMVAGGGVAAVILESSLNPLTQMPKMTDQVFASNRGIREMTMVELAQASAATVLDSTTIPLFENQLTAPPPVYAPKVVTSQGKVIRNEYTVAMASFTQQILPPSMNLLTPVWGYGGQANDAVTGASLGFVQSSPGPTFEAVRGTPIQVEWQNTITSPYMFPVDPTIHWANPNNIPMSTSQFPAYPPGIPAAQSPVLLVTHLHGGQNQSFSDGGPNSWFTSDGQHGPAYSTYTKTASNAAVYYYPNTQQPTTLWYHDHALGLTRLSVGSGLAGFYLIREPAGSDEVAAMLPAGKYEMPLVIQDRTFNTDGSFYYPSAGSDPQTHPYWVNSYLGTAIMVNGKVWPNMNVDRGQYRFRLLNGSNSRFYLLQFSNGMSFIQVGSDGGYLKAPVTLTSLLMAPAERADIIVDFSNLEAGQKVIFQNTSLISATAEQTQTLGQIMQFTANNAQGTTPFNISSAPTPFNPTLAESTFPTLPNPTKQRVLTLYEIAESNGDMKEALLDGQTWDASISETPELGTIEDWVIVNPTMDPHPIHLHLIQFQLVQRESLSAIGTYLDEWLKLNGTPPFNHPTINVQSLSTYLYGTQTLPQPQEQGWKDTILVNSGEVVTIRVRFAQQDGSAFPFDATEGPGYVWHCHLLEHEDNEMMRPYKVTKSGSIALPLAVSVAGVTAAAALIGVGYYYQSKRKKKQQANAEHGNQLNFMKENSEAQQPEELEERRSLQQQIG